jgi:hypothetical protein
MLRNRNACIIRSTIRVRFALGERHGGKLLARGHGLKKQFKISAVGLLRLVWRLHLSSKDAPEMTLKIEGKD